jgi:hypothetical protein
MAHIVDRWNARDSIWIGLSTGQKEKQCLEVLE